MGILIADPGWKNMISCVGFYQCLMADKWEKRGRIGVNNKCFTIVVRALSLSSPAIASLYDSVGRSVFTISDVVSCM